MMASAPGCHGQSTDLQTRARAPAEGMPVDFPARQRAVRSTDLESPRYYASSPYGVVRPHHLGVFVTLRAGMISLPER